MFCYFIALVRCFFFLRSLQHSSVCIRTLWYLGIKRRISKTKHSGKLNIVAHKTEEMSNAPRNEGKNGIGKPFLFSLSLVWCGVFAIGNSSSNAHSMCDWFALLYFGTVYTFDATSYNTKEIRNNQWRSRQLIMWPTWSSGRLYIVYPLSSLPLCFSLRFLLFSHSLYLPNPYCSMLGRHIDINVLINRTLSI